MAEDPKIPTNETPSEHNPGDPKAAAETTKPDDAGPAVDANAEAREAARREAIADAEQEAARLAGDAGEKAPQASTDAQQAPTSDDGSSGSETPLTKGELEGQVADLTDRLLRAHAEVQNLHRRLERDVAESQKYGITKFARDIVTMTDNFDRALSSVSPEATQDNKALSGLLDGVRMIEKEFQTVLAKHHVKKLNPTNELFDPHKHQAVMEKDDASVPAGTVIQVFQAGYELDERILRPAMVVVAKGGAKPVKPVADPGPADAANDTSAAKQSSGETDPPKSDDGAAA